MLKKFFKNESGQGLFEYAMILALIAVVVIAAFTAIGTAVKGTMDTEPSVIVVENEA